MQHPVSKMKTAGEILAEAAWTIAGMHNRPTMFIGSTSRVGAATTFNELMWQAHWFWAMIQSREAEFRRVLDRVRENHHCECQGFPDTFRMRNPAADEASVFEFVRQCWAEVDSELAIDISEAAVRRRWEESR